MVLDTESREIVIVVGTVTATVIVFSDVGLAIASPSLLRTILEDVTVVVVVIVDSNESVVVMVVLPVVSTAS